MSNFSMEITKNYLKMLKNYSQNKISKIKKFNNSKIVLLWSSRSGTTLNQILTSHSKVESVSEISLKKIY